MFGSCVDDGLGGAEPERKSGVMDAAVCVVGLMLTMMESCVSCGRRRLREDEDAFGSEGAVRPPRRLRLR